jgi:threonine dehydratase
VILDASAQQGVTVGDVFWVLSYAKGKNVVAVISGGNVDLQRISNVCEQFFVANEVK